VFKLPFIVAQIHCFNCFFPDVKKRFWPWRPTKPSRARIDELATKNTVGTLSEEELGEYVGYVRANKFVDVLRR
jgi:hypothetical protein